MSTYIKCACGAEWHGKSVNSPFIPEHRQRERAGHKLGCRVTAHDGCSCEFCQPVMKKRGKAETIGLLRALRPQIAADEWNGMMDGFKNQCCPICGAFQSTGTHADGPKPCWLRALLDALEG